MRVETNQLKIGCILSKDVQSITNQVLMRKNTILTEEFVTVLKVFLIDYVEVEETLVNGESFKPREVIEPKDNHKNILDKNADKPFLDLYLQAVHTYKKLFQGWQAGTKVDILSIRKILLPLLEKLDQQPEKLILLHHYATKQDYISHHAVTLGVLSAYLGRKLNYKKAEEIQLGIAGMMADSGMAKIPNSILQKKVALTSFEFEEIKNHPLYSYNMIKGIPGVTDGVLVGVLQHHEREDGSGYPMSLTSNKIHKFSRVISVIDIFHAMTSERQYKLKQSPYKVVELIIKDNFGKYDINVVQLLCKLVSNFSIGKKVRLNNNDIGEVIFIEPQSPTRPMIQIEKSNEFIKLANRSDLYIEEVLN
ncbi:HD-GYP domain-containing protein [Bacillaceae bacterium IKA-2]|nr:HD-GYP domain-containing protein [Bacillaceae bacterium IKA-2]